MQYNRKINVIVSPKCIRLNSPYTCTMTLREPLQCHYGTSVPWYQFYKVKSPNKKLRTNGHGIDVFLWHNVWYILTTTQKIGELKRLFQRVFSPFHLRIVRFLDIVLQLIFATGRWSSSIFSSIYFCCSPTFLLFIFMTLDLYLWHILFACFSSICWKSALYENITLHILSFKKENKSVP